MFVVPLVPVDHVEGVDVAVFRLRRLDDRDPLPDLGAKKLLPLRQLRIITGIDRQRHAHRLHRVVHVGVAPRRAGVLPPRILTPVNPAHGHQVQQFLALPSLFHLANAMRQPFPGDPLVLLRPETTKFDLIQPHRLQRLCGAWRHQG